MACADVAEEKRRAEGDGDLGQFCGSSARVLEIAGGQQNLDGSGKHSGAAAWARVSSENAPDRRGRGVDVSLRQAKQRQSWLRLSSALVRARVRRFGLR